MDTQRDHIFISHAAPEDNILAEWLSLQLKMLGYSVWCDITSLKGGERFWKEIENYIKNHTLLFLFITSKSSTSTEKEGAIKELQLAHTIKRANRFNDDFIIPLIADDIETKDFPILIDDQHAIYFKESWYNGFAVLLKKLDKINFPKKESQNNAEAVIDYWNSKLKNQFNIDEKESPLLSNEFLLSSLPSIIYKHYLDRSGIGSYKLDGMIPYPFRQEDKVLYTFCDATDTLRFLPAYFEIIKTDIVKVDTTSGISFNDASKDPDLTRKYKELLMQALYDKLKIVGLREYTMSGNSKSYYYEYNDETRQMKRFTGMEGKLSKRTLVGYKTRKVAESTERFKFYWHYAVSSRIVFAQKPNLLVKGHVLVSLDGKDIFNKSTRRQQSLRKKVTVNWRNDEWRDRLLAYFTCIADEGGSLSVPVTPSHNFAINCNPVEYVTPVDFSDPNKEAITVSDDE